MALKEPNSMSELVYFTNRDDGKFKARAWVFREICPKCKKGLMGKPKDSKTGKAKIRAPIYECPDCGYSLDAKEYEDGLTCNIEYTCPECNNHDQISVPYKRKSFLGVKAVVFNCGKCDHKMGITKKLKAPKKK
jgi:DNA-directed RNA polymerase subunit M/transcription elongation factor TFIIS